MKRRSTLLTLLWCFALPGLSHGQGNDDISNLGMLNKITVPSPSVAGIAKFTDVPVNLATGAVDISVPIYTINTGKLSLPITLRYDASGIRVNQNAGNTGIGFSITAEGTLMKSILGNKDNGDYHQYGLGWDNAAVIPNTTANFNLLDSWTIIDGVPDLYLYNFGGHSGKFIYADSIRLLPQADIEFTSYLDDVQNTVWKAVDEKGTQYYFTAVENTATKAATSISSSSTWFLTKIVDADHTDSIVLEYYDTYVESGFGKDYSINNWQSATTLGQYAIDMQPGDIPIPGTLTQFVQQVHGKQLKKITFNNGSVEYDIAWNNRQDLASDGSLGFNVPTVNNIFVKDRDGNIIKTAHFDYDYFTSSGSLISMENKRLRLRGLSFGPTPAALPSAPSVEKYTFDYVSYPSLPDKQSNAIDHWGYYNGAESNAGLIPDISFGGMHYYGADRNTDPYSVTAGMLSRVTYPTGGYTNFNFSAHMVSGGSPYLGTSIHNFNIRVDAEDAVGALESNIMDDLSIPDNDSFNNVTATLNTVATYASNTSAAVNNAQSKAELHEIGPSGNTIIATQSFNFVNGSSDYTKSSAVTLVRGRSYYIVVSTKGGVGCSVASRLAINWPTVRYTSATYAGGCRISQITTHDPVTNMDLVKNYSYSNASVYNWPTYYKQIHKFTDPDAGSSNGNNPPCNDIDVPGLLMSSNSIHGLGSGSHIAYAWAKEIVGANGEGGSTTYDYTVFDGAQVGEVPTSWRTGLLKKVSVRNSAGTLLKATIYHNKIQTDATHHYAGHTAQDIGRHPCANASNAGSYPAYFSQQVYDFPSEWVYVDTVEDIDYSTGITTLAASYYDNPWHKQVTRSLSFASDGGTLMSYIKYPTDYDLSSASAAPALALQSFGQKHIHAIPVEQYLQKSLGGAAPVTLSGMYTQFRQSAGLTLPDEVYKLDITQPLSSFQPSAISGGGMTKAAEYKLKAKSVLSDTRGNLLTLQVNGNENQAYLWGYQGQFPIAKVQNADNHYAAFTSFEADATGNWIYNPAAVTSSDRLTGHTAYNLSAGFAGPSVYAGPDSTSQIPHQTVQGNYIVSYWSKNGSVTVNGSGPTLTGATANGWTYYEHRLIDPFSQISLSGSGLIDELRFYKVGALMESYTYDPLTGATSYDNPTGTVILYYYDDMGRLNSTTDVSGNILNYNTYQYQGAE